MQWNKVESSNIAAVAYEDQKMYVQFHNGGEYQYDNVPVEVYNEVLEAESVGRAFHRLVKSQSSYYPFTRLN